MSHFVFFDQQGAIENTLLGDIATAELQGGEFIACSPDVSDTTHYIDTSGQEPVVIEKQPLDTTHTVDGLEVTFTNLAIGTMIQYEGRGVISDGQDDGVEFELPGTYTIELSGLVEYLDETLEVTVG